MAYDAHGDYVPPQRQYYAQTQQQAPVRGREPPMRSPGQAPDGYGYDLGQQPAPGWNEYQQGPAQTGAPPQRWQEDGWNANPNQAVPPNNGYARQPADRSFDPRYYQREARPGYGPQGDRTQYSPERQPGGSYGARPNQAQYSPERPAQPPYHSQDPSQNRYPPNPHQPPGARDPRVRTPNGNAPPLRSRTPAGQAFELEGSSAIAALPQQADIDAVPPPLFTKHENSRLNSMDEWKSRERARLQARVPETLAQDNAFPTFPNGKKKESRPSHEGSRPSTSNTADPPHAYHNGRPEMSRENSYGQGSSIGSRPSLDQHSITSMASHSKSYEDPHSKRAVDSGYGGPPYEQQESMDSRMRYGNQAQSPPPNANYDQNYSPPKTAPLPGPNGQLPYRSNTSPGYVQDYPPEAGPYDRAHQPPPGSHYQQQRMDPHRMRQPTDHYASTNPPPVNTQRSERSAYADHLSSSPAQATQNFNMPPPTGGRGYTQDHQQYQQSMPQRPNPQQDVRANSAPGYDEYRPPNRGPAQTTAPMTREEQIEAEMPNFENSAPSHSQTQARSHPPQAPHNVQNANTRPSANADQRYYQPSSQPPPQSQLKGPPPDRFQSPVSVPRPGPGSGPGPGGPGPGAGPLPGQNFSVPRPAYAQESYGEPGHQVPHPASGGEPPVRRSMDDARQPPYRPDPRGTPGPPNAQRFYGQPPTGGSDMSLPSPGLQQPRVGSAPPAQDLRRGPSTSTPVSATQSRRQVPYEEDSFNPDALPHHPMPVRPGLSGGGPTSQPARPPPVRNYDSSRSQGSSRSAPGREQEKQAVTAAEHQRKVSAEGFTEPVTHAEIQRLRNTVESNPHNPKQGLLLAKRLVEAARVLSSDGGRADARTTAKNREKYMNEAYKRVKKLVASGYPEAQFYLADCYGSGELGLEVDSKEAFNLYQAAAKQGHAQAAYRTAVCCEIGAEEGGGTRRDYGKAVQWYKRASALGDVAAMFKLGIILLKGLLGQPRNVGEALNWLKRSADRADAENPHALHELATLYESSNRDPDVRNKLIADDAHARELYKQAAKLGFKISQFRLGQAYEYGQLGLAIDNRASISWYSKAAAQGEHQAELALSGWYLTGAEGILEQSDTEAYLWARKAATSEPPQPKAMFAMGYFSEQGIGCQANTDEARRWYGRAASYKYPKALERLEELKRGSKGRMAPIKGKHNRKEQKKDDSDCVVM